MRQGERNGENPEEVEEESEVDDETEQGTEEDDVTRTGFDDQHSGFALSDRPEINDRFVTIE